MRHTPATLAVLSFLAVAPPAAQDAARSTPDRLEPVARDADALRATAVAADSALLQRIERFQAGFDQGNRLSGVLLVARDDQVVLRQAFGWADPVAGVPMTVTTPVPVASITKVFTRAMTVQLVREGRLGLNDRLSKFIPDFPRGDSITVLHLLSHRAGIPHRVTDPGVESRRMQPADLVALAATRGLVFSPGSQSSYSTAGYSVLARVLEVAGGRPFHALLRERLFDPAGMRQSFDLADPSPPPPPHHAAGSFLPSHGRLVPAPDKHLSYLVGGGSSVSTADDLLAFVLALRDGRIPGVRLSDLEPRGTARWLGASNGYFAWVDVQPAERLITIWVGNSWGGAGSALLDALPALLRGEQPAAPITPPRGAAPSAAQRAEYVGFYRTRPGAAYEISDDGELRLEGNILVPTGRDLFWLPSTSRPVRFVRDETGRVVSLEEGAGAAARTLPRVRHSWDP